MADISIKKNHQRSREDVRATIEQLAGKLSDRLGGQWCWEGDVAVCEAHGVEARVGFDTESVSIDVTLPRMMKPLRKKIEATVEEHYGRYFGGPVV